MDTDLIATVLLGWVPLGLCLGISLAVASALLRDWWTECRHGPDETDFIDIPPDWGLDVGVWCVCRRCGARTVLTRARLRELDLE